MRLLRETEKSWELERNILVGVELEIKEILGVWFC